MANFQLKINIFAYFVLLSTFTGSIYAFLSTLQNGKIYSKTEHRQSQPSFIDINEVIDKEISVNYNSGLGKERLLYVDDDIIVVDKPTACSTAPGFREFDSLATRIAAVFKIDRVDKMIVHRLDYATSGLVIFARNDNALTSLHTQFRQRNKVHKRYSAIVKGNVKYFDGEIDLPLGKQVECPPLCKVDPFHGKVSTTTWSLFGRHGGNSHIHLIPHTGRYVLDMDQFRLILCYD
jgi:tRNA pseudouridine32 synthase / 23S rRNA pseudouridine746 synthase